MTDPTDLDELASAYLDGEVSAEERARVDADPDLLARVDRLRAVSEAVGGGLTPLTEAQGAALRRRAALAGEEEAPAPPRAPSRTVARRSWLPSPAVAAAIVVVIALVGIGLIATGSGGGDADQAGSGTVADQSEGAGASASATTEPSSGLADLGSFATEDELSLTLEQVDITTFRTDAPPSTRATEQEADALPTASVERCDLSVVAGQSELGERLAVATAEVAARPVLVFSHSVEGSGAEPLTQLTVVDTESCQVLFAIQR